LRTINQRLLATLRRKGYTKDSLGQFEFKLVGEVDSQLYSADLSKASDYIQHDILYAILRGAADGQQWSDKELDALAKCSGAMAVTRNGVEMLTSSAAHMGLGGTWAVLSVLNLFALDRATGGDTRKGRVCGDDMIGLLTPAERDTYVRILTKSCKLKLNEEKSFYGANGVFCEHFVEIDHEDSKETMATCHKTRKIAESTGAKTRYGFTDDGMGIIESLSSIANDPRQFQAHRVTAKFCIRQRARSQFLLRNLPVSLGGSNLVHGRVAKDAIAILCQFFKSGKLPFTGHHQKVDMAEGPALKESGQFSAAKVATAIRIQNERFRRLENGETLTPLRQHVGTVKRQVRRMIKQGRGLPFQPPSKEHFTLAARRRIAHFPLSHWHRPKVFRRVLRIALNGRKTQYCTNAQYVGMMTRFGWAKMQDGSLGKAPWEFTPLVKKTK